MRKRLKERWFVTSVLDETCKLEAACEPLTWAEAVWRSRFITCSSSSILLSPQCLCFPTHLSLFFPTLFSHPTHNCPLPMSHLLFHSSLSKDLSYTVYPIYCFLYFCLYHSLPPLHSMVGIRKIILPCK